MGTDVLRQGTATDSINDFSGVDPVLAGLVSSGTVAVITSSAQTITASCTNAVATKIQ